MLPELNENNIVYGPWKVVTAKMKRKALRCAQNPCRGPGSSGVRLFQLPVLCHHFNTPHLRAVQCSKDTHIYPCVSICPRNPGATLGVSHPTISERGMDGTMPALEAATWPLWGEQHPSAARGWRGRDDARWSLQSWQWKAGKVWLAGLPTCIYSKKHSSPTSSVTGAGLVQWEFMGWVSSNGNPLAPG